MILIYEYVKELPEQFKLIQTDFEIRDIFENTGLKDDPKDYSYLWVLFGEADYKTIYSSNSADNNASLTLLYDNKEV